MTFAMTLDLEVPIYKKTHFYKEDIRIINSKFSTTETPADGMEKQPFIIGLSVR
jgi:hypothetical protein